MELLKVEKLCKVYDKGENEVKAVDEVSFTVPKGQMVAIVGASGSGKSTLLHLIGAVDRPTSGKIWLDGQDVFAHNKKELAIFRRRQVGLIYQFYNLNPVLTAEENIVLPILMDGRKPDKAQLEKILDML
jgi:putative ABC transport system ATP-binding protein